MLDIKMDFLLSKLLEKFGFAKEENSPSKYLNKIQYVETTLRFHFAYIEVDNIAIIDYQNSKLKSKHD